MITAALRGIRGLFPAEADVPKEPSPNAKLVERVNDAERRLAEANQKIAQLMAAGVDDDDDDDDDDDWPGFFQPVRDLEDHVRELARVYRLMGSGDVAEAKIELDQVLSGIDSGWRCFL